ncbi:hypothetical protein J4G02_17945, partial [Candidatus Poribacteria bacterium]|nr:hypothetical protein [Candidatus Poribacteria bacterium]
DDNSDNDFGKNSSLFAAKIPTAYGSNEGGGADSQTLFVRGKETVSLKYIDPYYSSTQQDQTVNTTVTTNTGSTGTIAITTKSGQPIEAFELGETLYIQVEDPDLLKAVADQGVNASKLPHTEITVRCIVPEMQEVEPVKLTYQPEQGRYVGSVVTGYNKAPASNNGRLEALGAQRVVAIYLDEIQLTGETDVPVSAQVGTAIGDTGRLELGQIDRLLLLDNQKFFKAGSTLSVLLQDIDLNRDEDQQETVHVLLNGDRLKDQYQLTLKEAHDVSGQFTGTFATQYATNANPSNDVLEVTGKEVVTVSYVDALAGSGNTKVTLIDTAQVSAGQDGILDILKANYVTNLENFNAGDRLYFRLHDTDITHEFVEITLVGETLKDRETVQLFQSMEEG